MNNDLLNELNAASVTPLPDKVSAFVKNIEQKTAKEVYGDEARDPEQPVFVVTATNDDFGISARATLPYYPADKLKANSNTGRWKNKYGNIDIGVEVELVRKGRFYEVFFE